MFSEMCVVFQASPSVCEEQPTTLAIAEVVWEFTRGSLWPTTQSGVTDSWHWRFYFGGEMSGWSFVSPYLVIAFRFLAYMYIF